MLEPSGTFGTELKGELDTLALNSNGSLTILLRSVTGAAPDLAFLEGLAFGLSGFYAEAPARATAHRVALLASLSCRNLRGAGEFLARLNQLAVEKRNHFLHRVILFEPTRKGGTQFPQEERVAQATLLLASLLEAGQDHPLATFPPVHTAWPVAPGDPAGAGRTAIYASFQTARVPNPIEEVAAFCATRTLAELCGFACDREDPTDLSHLDDLGKVPSTPRSPLPAFPRKPRRLPGLDHVLEGGAGGSVRREVTDVLDELAVFSPENLREEFARAKLEGAASARKLGDAIDQQVQRTLEAPAALASVRARFERIVAALEQLRRGKTTAVEEWSSLEDALAEPGVRTLERLESDVDDAFLDVPPVRDLCLQGPVLAVLLFLCVQPFVERQGPSAAGDPRAWLAGGVVALVVLLAFVLRHVGARRVSGRLDDLHRAFGGWLARLSLAIEHKGEYASRALDVRTVSSVEYHARRLLERLRRSETLLGAVREIAADAASTRSSQSDLREGWYQDLRPRTRADLGELYRVHLLATLRPWAPPDGARLDVGRFTAAAQEALSASFRSRLVASENLAKLLTSSGFLQAYDQAVKTILDQRNMPLDTGRGIAGGIETTFLSLPSELWNGADFPRRVLPNQTPHLSRASSDVLVWSIAKDVPFDAFRPRE